MSKKRLTMLQPRLREANLTRLPSPKNRQATRALHTDSAAWRDLRAQVLLRDLYMCQGHPPGQHAEGCDGLATQVDHIDANSHNNAIENLNSLSAWCHGRKTAREQNAA